jgi:hypothetical protein
MNSLPEMRKGKEESYFTYYKRDSNKLSVKMKKI